MMREGAQVTFNPSSYDDSDTVRLAKCHAAALECLVFTTYAVPGLSVPETLADVLEWFEVGAQYQRAVLDQLANFVRTEHDAGRLGHDTGSDPACACRAALAGLAVARSATARAVTGIGDARVALASLYGPGPDPDGDATVVIMSRRRAA